MLCKKSRFISPGFCPACIVPKALMSNPPEGPADPPIVLKLAGMLLLNMSMGFAFGGWAAGATWLVIGGATCEAVGDCTLVLEVGVVGGLEHQLQSAEISRVGLAS